MHYYCRSCLLPWRLQVHVVIDFLCAGRFSKGAAERQTSTAGSGRVPKNTNGRGARRLAEAAPHCLVQALRRKANVLQPGRSCSRLPLPKHLHLPNCEACTLKAPEPVYVHTQLLRTLCMTAFFTDVLVILPRRKKTSCHTLSQGFKESRIQSLRDSRTQGFKHSRTRGLQDSRIPGF